jgi:hypothetical protein
VPVVPVVVPVVPVVVPVLLVVVPVVPVVVPVVEPEVVVPVGGGSGNVSSSSQATRPIDKLIRPAAAADNHTFFIRNRMKVKQIVFEGYTFIVKGKRRFIK